jgi:DNA-binding MarR family transcriptional regulator
MGKGDVTAVTDAVLQASRVFVAVAVSSLNDVAEDVTLAQFRVLVILSTYGPQNLASLAESLDVNPSTATRLCDRLVRKRLVRRTQGTEDRRSTQLHLAAAGRRLVERVTARRRRDLAAIASRLPEDARARAIEVLGAFADAAGEERGVDLFGWNHGPSHLPEHE